MVDTTERKPMSDKPTSDEELLKESRRTTHAVRAIASFILLVVTYQVFASIGIGLGVGISAAGEEGGFGLIVIGALVSIVGLVHALWAGLKELALSDRMALVSAPNVVPSETTPARDERALLPGVCDCTKWERGAGGTAMKEDVKFCLRCERVVPQ